MQRTRTAISGVLGSLGIALLVVGLALAMENTAAAKDEDGNFNVCTLCTENCDEVPPPSGGCSGFCDGWLCGASCGCRRDKKTGLVCVCRTNIFNP